MNSSKMKKVNSSSHKAHFQNEVSKKGEVSSNPQKNEVSFESEVSSSFYKSGVSLNDKVSQKSGASSSSPKSDVSSNVWFIQNTKLSLHHATHFEREVKKKKASFFDLFAQAFGKKKELEWFYSVLPEHVIIKAGKLLLKSKIHEVSKGLSFVRVPQLGSLVIDNGILRKPTEQELSLIKKSPVFG